MCFCFFYSSSSFGISSTFNTDRKKHISTIKSCNLIRVNIHRINQLNDNNDNANNSIYNTMNTPLRHINIFYFILYNKSY